MTRPWMKTAAAGLALCVGMTLAAATAAAQIRPAERQKAAQEHPAVLEQFGGAYEGPQQAYVAQIGQRVAAAAGAQGQCTFTLVNTDVVNAFAVPGCYVYVTRGLLSIVNSDDELAFVMGHEVGHILGRHSEQRQSRSTLTGIGAMILGAVTKNNRIAEIAGQGAQLYTLGFSRTQEFEADEFGIRYLVAAGWRPEASSNLLRALQRSDELTARTRGRDDANAVPAWARTHPLTSERVTRADARARAAGGGGGRGAQPDRYFSAIDGMLFGDDPEQGFVLGQNFAHPQLRLAFTAPRGFTLTNSSRAVLIEGPNGIKAQFAGGRSRSRTLDDHAAAIVAETAGQAQYQLGRAQRTTVNGLETVILPARAQGQSGVVDLTVAAYRFSSDTVYHFVAMAPAGRSAPFEPLFRSVRHLSDAEAAQLQPRRIQVSPVRQGDTAASLIRRMEIENQAEWFAMLNNASNDAELGYRDRVKLIVRGR